MKVNPLEYYDRVHPHDLISRAIKKIDFINAFVTDTDSDCGLVPAVAHGLYYSLLNISQELELALDKIQGAKP